MCSKYSGSAKSFSLYSGIYRNKLTADVGSTPGQYQIPSRAEVMKFCGPPTHLKKVKNQRVICDLSSRSFKSISYFARLIYLPLVLLRFRLSVVLLLLVFQCYIVHL